MSPKLPRCHGRNASIEIPEGSGRFVESYSATDPEGGTVGLSLVGTDSGDFEEFGSGVLSFLATPDYESRGRLEPGQHLPRDWCERPTGRTWARWT